MPLTVHVGEGDREDLQDLVRLDDAGEDVNGAAQLEEVLAGLEAPEEEELLHHLSDRLDFR